MYRLEVIVVVQSGIHGWMETRLSWAMEIVVYVKREVGMCRGGV